jgi:ABC-type antimicrobial peptide transport system permease subunit
MQPVVYFPFTQAFSGGFDLVVRTSLGAGLREPLRSAVASIDRDVPVYGMKTMEAMAAGSTPVLLRALVMRLLGWFALAALLLGGVGVYGMLAEAMTARTREIGVRMALGATRAGIGRLVVRSGLTPAIAGLAAGVVLMAVSMPALRSLLFGVTLLDVPSLATVIVTLTCVTLAACALPARRAMRLPVTTALRVE